MFMGPAVGLTTDTTLVQDRLPMKWIVLGVDVGCKSGRRRVNNKSEVKVRVTNMQIEG